MPATQHPSESPQRPQRPGLTFGTLDPRARRAKRTRTGAILVMASLVAVLLAIFTSNLWLVGAAIVPVAAFVLREQSPELAAKSTATTLAAAVSLILLGLGIAHA
ncbi:hypothetical protein [Winogradskya humida]|uniref:Uncharacterized protein n=1 Tax=Winogradskya humida TaxID=113566 RepID=A0ABQ3ZKC5_9ACTN|nr:hypothetical protein [Actinoplanes humidus]GIE19040.1 hypothetical protein Ahu01nite_021420 [Actinoplanes humidus]